MLYQIHKDSNSTDTVNSVAISKLSQPICLINTPTVQFRVCDTYKAVRKLFSIHHLNLYIYDMFTCYILSPLYIEENSVYYSSMHWEIFSKIFVAEFSAHDRVARAAEPAQKCRRAGLGPARACAAGHCCPLTACWTCHPSFPDRAGAAVCTSSQGGWGVWTHRNICLPFSSLLVTPGSKPKQD